MKKEMIMSVEVDKDGHEYNLTRERELVRCEDCRFGETIDDISYDDKTIKRICCFVDDPEWGNYKSLSGYCYRGRKK